MSRHPNQERSRRVLIVDRSPENREVLRTVLQRRGMEILEAAEPRRGLALARRHRPDVIVVDLEHESPEDALWVAELNQQTIDGRLLVLGGVSHLGPPLTPRSIAKPYHFGPVIRTIEQMAERVAP